MSLISILIPIYNNELYLDRCINSVLRQTYRDVEIILIDDGSIDRSFEICHSYEKAHENIRFYGMPHQGVSASRQIALDKSKGEYIFFLDSDDLISENALEILHNIMVSTDSDIVQCTYLVAGFNESNAKKYEKSIPNPIIYDEKEKICVFGSGISKLNCMLWGKLYKKGMFLKALNFQQEKFMKMKLLCIVYSIMQIE